MSPDFSQRYECSMSKSFLSKLCHNCPCILLSCRLTFVYSTMLSFIFLLSFCTSVFRHPAACNTAESVFCWCFLTICISGSSFLSTYMIIISYSILYCIIYYIILYYILYYIMLYYIILYYIILYYIYYIIIFIIIVVDTQEGSLT